MKSKLSKIVTVVIAVISVIGILLFANVVRIGDDNAEAFSGAVSSLVGYSVYLLIVSVFIALALSLWSLIKNPAALKKTLIGIGILLVILVISYSMASDVAVLGTQGVPLKDGAAGSTSKWVSTGIIYSIFLGVIGGLLFLYDLLKGLVK